MCNNNFKNNTYNLGLKNLREVITQTELKRSATWRLKSVGV